MNLVLLLFSYQSVNGLVSYTVFFSTQSFVLLLRKLYNAFTFNNLVVELVLQQAVHVRRIFITSQSYFSVVSPSIRTTQERHHVALPSSSARFCGCFVPSPAIPSP